MLIKEGTQGVPGVVSLRPVKVALEENQSGKLALVITVLPCTNNTDDVKGPESEFARVM